MKLIINKNRTTTSVGTWGTKNENDYEILEFEFPAELEEYNKRIVYYLDDERVWDAIVDNKAYITNAVTQYEKVKAYVWLTKENAEREADTDFRTKLFEMKFFENENADGIVPTEQQIDGFNTMLTAMNRKIDEVKALEQTIGAAEAERQENENTRISNESTRESNESTRQENEQTRQTQEADRERRTNETIAQITDMTEAYNQNAQEKIADFDTYVDAAEQSINSNATEKTTTFNNNASTKTSEFNTNVESKTTAFNDNATQKTTNFDNNASEKTDEFNTNAQNKIDEYDEHIVDYQAQIDELQEEVEELSENMPWNTTEQATEISVDDAAKYSRNKLELFGNTSQFSTTGKNKLPYPYEETTLTRKGITFTDNGDGSITINGTAQGNSSFTLFGSAYPDMQENFSGNYILGKNCSYSILCRAMYADKQESGSVIYRTVGQSTGTSVQMNTTQYPKGYVEITVFNGTTVDNVTIYPMITDTQDNDYEPYTGGQPSPSPDYPQPIHVVTGNNTIKENSANIVNFAKLNTIDIVDGKVNITSTSGFQANFYFDEITLQPGDYTFSFKTSAASPTSSNQSIVLLLSDNTVMEQAGTMYYNTSRLDYGWFTINSPVTIKGIRVWFATSHIGELSNIMISKGTYTNANLPLYVPYYHADYPINLGSLELCKIGNYQDYLYKENGNWYKKPNILKTNFSANTRISSTQKKTNDQAFNFVFFDYCDLNYNNLLAICTHYPSKQSFVSKSIFNNYQTDTYIVHPFDDIFTSEMTWEEAKAKFHEVYDDKLIFYTKLEQDPIQITDSTLISQLDAIYEHLQLVKGTNNITVTAEDLAPYMQLSYMQDLKSKLDNLDSRLSLLE